MTMFHMNAENLEPLRVEIVPRLLELRWPRFLYQWEKHPYGLGPRSHPVLAALEKSAGVLLSVQAWLRQTVDSPEGFPGSKPVGSPAGKPAGKPDDDPSAPPSPGWSRLAAVHAAARVLAHELDGLTGHRVRAANPMPLRETRQVLEDANILDAFLKDALHYTQDHVRQGHDADTALCAYAHLLCLSCLSLARDPRHGAQHERHKNIHFHIYDIHFPVFGEIRKDQTSLVLPVRMENIIGNQEFLRASRRLVRDLIAYDPETGQNPKRINPILFALGKPGCGKTASAHAVGQHLLAEAAAVGLMAKFCVIRRTDWASAYQNASASALIDRFTSELKGFPGVVAFYWPDIDTAFGARGGGDLRAEEKSILGAAFGLFDGTILPANGQWILLCDANYMQMDDATVSRLTQQPFLLEGPVTATDYVRLVRDEFLGDEYKKHIECRPEQWTEFGELAARKAVSGRDCAHFARRLISRIEDVNYPDGFFQANFEKRRHFLSLIRKNLEFSVVLSEFQYTLEFILAARQKEEEDQVSSLARELIRMERARRLAEEEADRE